MPVSVVWGAVATPDGTAGIAVTLLRVSTISFPERSMPGVVSGHTSQNLTGGVERPGRMSLRHASLAMEGRLPSTSRTPI
eukprot:682998-Hanusia_phi.AAC.5